MTNNSNKPINLRECLNNNCEYLFCDRETRILFFIRYLKTLNKSPKKHHIVEFTGFGNVKQHDGNTVS